MTASPRIEPYLFFNGRCEEAMQFYQRALGAELVMLMRFKDSPQPHAPGVVPPGFEDKVMHASLRIGSCLIMASDGCSTEPPAFSGFTLSLSLPSPADAERAFAALSDGGEVRMPLSQTFWSPCFGMVEDRFGIGWMVTVASV